MRSESVALVVSRALQRSRGTRTWCPSTLSRNPTEGASEAAGESSGGGFVAARSANTATSRERGVSVVGGGRQGEMGERCAR